jgi:hypothetical protein
MYKQKEIRLIGANSRGGGFLDGNSTTTAAILDLRYSGSDAKIVTLGSGELIIRDLVITDFGTSSTPFILTTNTALLMYNVSFQGNPSKSGAAGTCDQDAIILGGTTASNGNTTSSAFSGYGTIIESCRFSRIRRGIYGRAYCNAIKVFNCTWDLSAGAPDVRTTTGTATGSNGASTITMSSTTGTIKVGQVVSGTGIGRPNGNSSLTYVTAVSGTAPTQTVTLSTNNAAAVSGTITFVDVYAAIEFDGTAGAAQGNVLIGNVMEMQNYKYGIIFRNSMYNQGTGNGFYDPPANVTGYAQGAAGTNTITMLGTTGTLAVGQTVTSGLNLPYYAAITALSGTAPTQTVTLSANNNTDVGATTTGTGTSGQFTITTSVATTGTIAVNQLVTGTGVGTNAIVTAVSGTAPTQTVTVNVANSGTVSGTITFGTPVAFDGLINIVQTIGQSSGSVLLQTYNGTSTKNATQPGSNGSNMTGLWTFVGTNSAADNSYPIIGLQPNYVPLSTGQSMIKVSRSQFEVVNPSTTVFQVLYDGSVVASTVTTGNTAMGSSGVVQSSGALNMYAGSANDVIQSQRGVFRDRPLATASRPSAATVGAGSCYYDTTLNKPAWSDGTNWRDAAGTIV